jgi:hypothetical protein
MSQFILAVLFHSVPIVCCVMQLIRKRQPEEFSRKKFTAVAVTVMCFVGIGMGVSAGKIISSVREARRESKDDGRITFLQVSTEGIVLLSSLLFSTISVLLCWFLEWNHEEKSVVCPSAQSKEAA